LALNYTDGKLFYKDNAGVVQVIASKAAAAGVLSFSAGSTGLTPSTATSGAVTLAGTLGISNGGTGITSFGTGVQTALGVNVGTAGSFLVNGGVLGTPSSGTVTNLTGTASININGTVGATTASTGAFTTMSGTGQLTLTNASNYNLYASGAGANFMQGALGIGNLANAYNKLLISGTLPTGSSVARAVEVTATVPSGATSQGLGFLTALSTQAASFALTNMQHYVATQGTVGAGSSISNQFGFSVDSSLTGATNNYGFYSDIASGTGRFNFYASGTAANVFAGTTSLGGAVGSESLRVTPVASAVNYWSMVGATTGGSPALYSQGSDADISALVSSKGAGNVQLRTNSGGNIQFVAAHAASSVNYIQVAGSATGAAPYISVQGSDTNIDFSVLPKGTGGLATYSTGQATTSLSTTTLGSGIGLFDSGASAGNGGSVVFGAASGAWRFAAIKSYATNGASNTQGDLYFLTRRNATDATLTPSMQIASSGAVSLGFASAVSQPSLVATPIASAVNYLNVYGGTTGSAVTIGPKGSDTNIPLWFQSQGTASFVFGTGGGANFYQQFAISNTTSAVNYLQVTGSATGIAATISSQGSDTNIDLALTPKGTGVLSFGTYTAGTVVQAGYITIKDAGGTTRRLLVG
jgi:hypothetical protein